MALVTLNFCSYELGMDTEVTILLPERRTLPHPPLGDKTYPVLYLLHGHSRDNTSWIRGSQLEFYLWDSDVIVVMPSCRRSFYTDGVHGHRYFSFLTDELPTVIENWFPASNKREDRSIAGLSMGGYGAFKAALRRPDLYARAASLSGALLPIQLREDTPDQRPDFATKSASTSDGVRIMTANFGNTEDFPGSFFDLMAAARELAASGGPIPALYQCCGTEDYLYAQNQTFREFIQTETPAIPLTYWESPGIHDWAFWNREIVTVLGHFGMVEA